MAEPISKATWTPPDDGPPPVAAEFPGCRAIDVPPDELDDFEGRLEYWDARNEIAIVAEPATTYHEYSAQRLARLLNLIALRRGSPIDVIGAAALVVRNPEGERRRAMAADQIVYLRPGATRPCGPDIEYGVNELPDVVLEVDYSTDVRRRKLGIYESWGFPEVWVEVPEANWRYRPKSRLSGLAIHVLEEGRYVEAASSRAFPGWTAQEIHRALNEADMSLSTVDVLRRVGDTLGASEGTGPDDDLFLRRERAEGRAEGHAEGHAEGRREALRLAVLGVSSARGLAATPALYALLTEIGPTADAVTLVQLAYECQDEGDFLRRADD